MKKAFIILISILVCCSCGSTKVIPTIPVETVKEVYLHDTLVIRDIQFDSIYVNHDLLTDRSRDTVLIRETSTIYKYQMLRDTIERVKIETVRDSIPYEVKIIETKEIPRPLTWFDHLTRACFWVLIGVIFVLFVRAVYPELCRRVFKNKIRVL